MAVDKITIRKQRCKNGGEGVIFRLKDSDEETVILESFIKTESPIGRKIANKYEYLLVLAKTNPDKYLEIRDEFYLDMAEWIHEENLIQEWSDLILVIDRYRTSGFAIIDALMSEMMETWNYLSDHREKMIYGANTTTGELYYTKEIFGDWDRPLMELQFKYEKNLITKTKYQEEKMKFLFNDKIAQINTNENIIDINIFNLIPLINQRTKRVFPEKFLLLAYTGEIEPFPRQWKPTEHYMTILEQRSYMLDKAGVTCTFRNAEKFTEIYLVEDLTKDNQVVMMYKLSAKNGSFMGYYLVKDKIFYSPYKYSSGNATVHPQVENFVLEVYADLVCDMPKETKRIYAIERVSDIEEIENYKSTKVYYQPEIEDGSESASKGGRRRGSKQRPHDRRFALRKLREGQEASEEAVERAREYGINLKDGYTFVQAYHVGEKKNTEQFRERM